jgi:hypothetical protein
MNQSEGLALLSAIVKLREEADALYNLAKLIYVSDPSTGAVPEDVENVRVSECLCRDVTCKHLAPQHTGGGYCRVCRRHCWL